MKKYLDWLFENHPSEPKPLYVSRSVINGEEILNHFKEQLPACPLLTPDDLHITLCYSKTPVVWDNIHKGVPDKVNIVSRDKRKIELFGKDGECLVMVCPCDELEDRHNHMRNMGASYDYEYHPHITLSCGFDSKGYKMEDIKPFRGVIRLGPEKFEALDQD